MKSMTFTQVVMVITTTPSAFMWLVSPLQTTVDGKVMNRAMSNVSISRAELTFKVELQSAVTETIARILLTQKKKVTTQISMAPPRVTLCTARFILENMLFMTRLTALLGLCL